MKTKSLVIGASGQIGSELTYALASKFGNENVIAADIREPLHLSKEIQFVELDILNKELLRKVIIENEITDVYLLAALLSATAERNPLFAWKLNMDGLMNGLELAKEGLFKKLFWPSSIAVFGPTTPKENTPQTTIMEPSTVYGISKLAGERWCEYYYNKFNVDVRSIRYPGLISYSSPPGGGTTDYAVDIFHQALKNKAYECFLKKDRKLPMMYMEDAIQATIQLMQEDANNLSIRSSYNISGISFTPSEIAKEISKEIPDFTISYAPDFRDEIAASWPESIDDSSAQRDWNWKAKFDLTKLSKDMIFNLSKILKQQ